MGYFLYAYISMATPCKPQMAIKNVALFNELDSLGIHPLAVTLEPHREEDKRYSLEYPAPIRPW